MEARRGGLGTAVQVAGVAAVRSGGEQERRRRWVEGSGLGSDVDAGLDYTVALRVGV